VEVSIRRESSVPWQPNKDRQTSNGHKEWKPIFIFRESAFSWEDHHSSFRIKGSLPRNISIGHDSFPIGAASIVISQSILNASGQQVVFLPLGNPEGNLGVLDCAAEIAHFGIGRRQYVKVPRVGLVHLTTLGCQSNRLGPIANRLLGGGAQVPGQLPH
jgi:hypothetical protein